MIVPSQEASLLISFSLVLSFFLSHKVPQPILYDSIKFVYEQFAIEFRSTLINLSKF